MKRLILLLCVISGCSSMKHQLKTAEKYEQNGMTDSALEIYEKVYENKNNVDAHIALNRIFNQHLVKTVGEINFLRISGDYTSALSRCEVLAQEIENATWYEPNTGIDLKALYLEIRGEQNQILLDELKTVIMNHDHQKADLLLIQLKSGGAQTEELAHLERLNQIIPLYYSAEKAYENGYFNEAHDFYSEILELDPYYKDVQEKRDDCFQRLKFTMAFVSSNKGYQSVGAPIAKAIKKELNEIDSPFLILIDPEHDELVLEEQRRSMTGITETSIEGGNLLEANYLLVGKVRSFQSSLSPITRNSQRGFEGSHVRSEKVVYTEVNQRMKVYLVYTYDILDTESGEIVSSGEVSVEDDLQNTCIEYEGNRGALYPGNWTLPFFTMNSDYVNQAGKKHLDVLLSNTPLKGREQQILDQYVSELAEQVAKEIECLILGGDLF